MKKINLKYDPRPQQLEILDFVKNSIESENKKFMMVDAPTGVGKSFAAVMIADWYIKEVNPRARVTMLTNSKILQDQYVKDFDFISSLKGSNSYWCRNSMMACGESKILNKAKENKFYKENFSDQLRQELRN